MERLSEHYTDNVTWFNEMLGVGRSVDIVSRDYLIGGRRARLWVIDGYGKDGTLERMGAFWLSLTVADMVGLADMQGFIDRFITFSETNISFDRNGIVTNVLLGKTLLLVEGLSGAALMDAKEYPARSVGEPPGLPRRLCGGGGAQYGPAAPPHPGPPPHHGGPQGGSPLPHRHGAVLPG